MKGISHKDIIHARFVAQGIHNNSSPYMKLDKICERAWWVKHDFSINARLSRPLRKGIQKLKRNITEVYLNRTKVFVSDKVFMYLFRTHFSDFEFEGQDDSLLSLFETRTHMTDGEIRRILNSSSIAKTLFPYLKNWSIVTRYRDRKKEYWRSDRYYEFLTREQRNALPENDVELYRLIITEILGVYPYLSLGQIEFLSGVSKFTLGRPIFEMLEEGLIEKLVMRYDRPVELFKLAGAEYTEELVPVVVLDQMDPLVCLTRYEVPLPKNKFFVFVGGTPSAGFDLKKNGDQGYFITHFNRTKTSTLSQEEILSHLIKWGENLNLNLSFDHKESPQGRIATRAIHLLRSRGYSFQGDFMVLNKEVPRDSDARSNFLDIYRKLPELRQPPTSPDELTGLYVQIESKDSFLLRSPTPYPSYSGLHQMIGLGERLSVVNFTTLSHIYNAHYSDTGLSLLQSRILSYISDNPVSSSEDILASFSTSNPRKVIQSIKYLEYRRKIIRSEVYPSYSPTWEIFPVSNTPSEQEIQESKLWILRHVLKSTFPLTSLQLARYTGWSTNEIVTLLNTLIQSEEVVEGYFMKPSSEIQFTHRTFLSVEPVSADEVVGVSLYPASEPLALILPEFIARNQSLQPKYSFGSSSDVFMTVVDGSLEGYIVKYPETKRHEDGLTTHYSLDVFLTSQERLLPVLERVNEFFLGRRKENGRLLTFCGTPFSSRKFEDIHFTIELLGYRI